MKPLAWLDSTSGMFWGVAVARTAIYTYLVCTLDTWGSPALRWQARASGCTVQYCEVKMIQLYDD